VAPLPENVGFALLSEAEAARAAGGPQVEQWVAAAEHWEQSGQVFHATYSRMREAQARLGQGEPPDRAWAILRFSARAAAKLGAVGLTITIEDLLAMAESEGSEAAASVAQLESS
jgi:hypothetical protein